MCDCCKTGTFCNTNDKPNTANNSNKGAKFDADECCHEEEERGWLLPGISLVMLVAGIIMEYTGVPRFFQNRWVEFGWFVAAFLPVGFDVIQEGISLIRKHDYFNEFTLMTIASVGAFCIGEYPEGVAVMLFYCIGETLQDKAVDRVKANINRLLKLKVTTVEVKGRGLMAPEEVAVGDEITVKPGERVALDSTLMSGAAAFDTSALTGESLPRDIETGGEVLAGMIPLSSRVTLKVARPYSDSALARIIRLVQEAQEKKAKSEKFITRFARIYTPTVFLLAVLLVAVPAIVGAAHPAFHFVFSQWLYRALVFLVVSCPCALVISVPLSYFVGIGAASRQGILVKGGNYLDLIRRTNTIAFDKTGTLTTGRLKVEETDTADGIDVDRLLQLMASAESGSTHPLAATLLAYARSRGAAPLEDAEVKEVPGYGVTARVEGHEVAAGNTRLLARLGIPYPASLDLSGATMIACAVDGAYAGCVTFSDDIKSDAREAIGALKAAGIENMIILSGDSQAKADETAKSIGIPRAEGNLLPEHKAEYVSRLTDDRKNTVAYVGDGINDAPVLARSHVGIAMGALGADIAVENADVIIQTDQLSKLPALVRLGRRTHAIIVENIVFAIVVKVAILVLGACGWVSLWAAVFADVGVSLIAILNAMRIFGGNRRG